MPAPDPPRRRLPRPALAAALALLAALVPASACRPEPAPPPGGRRLVIVGVDGATWSVVSPLMEQGRMPYLARLYRSGSAGLMKSLEPMLPAALWTTVATGKARGAHGIEAAAEKTPGRYAARPVTADDRRAPPLWTIASARGLTAGVVNWPVTFPTDAIQGFMIAEGYDPASTGDHGYLYPEGALGDEREKGEGLALSPAARAIADLDPALRSAFDEDLAALSRGAALYRVYQPRVALFRFVSIDVASHRFWQYHEPRLLDLSASRGHPVAPDRAAALAAALPGTYAWFDEWLGQLLSRLPEKSTLLIVSDCGFRGVVMTDYLHIDIDALLARLGYLVFSPAGGPDWGRTRAFTLDAIGGQRRSIFLNVKGREERGVVDPVAAPALGERLAAQLRELKTREGEPIFRAVTAAGQPEPGQPDITVIENLAIDPAGMLRLGGRDLPASGLYRRYGEDFGAHDPAGILLAAGDGIAAGRTGWAADLYDVAPTALYLMGLPLASDMPGRPVGPILAQPVPPGYPMVPTYNDLPPAPPPVRRTPAAARDALRQLEDLGHLR